MDDTNVEYERAKFFKSKSIAVHITKHDGQFYNGIILDLEHDFVILQDEVLGEMPIFFSEIKQVEPREPKVSKEFQ